MAAAQHIERTGQFHATVTGVTDLSARMRRIELQSAGLAERPWPLACDIAIVLTADGREVRRRYTVRAAAADRLTVDAVLHGHGPGSSWAQALQPGDPVTFFGPRGQVPVADAEPLVAFTDEAGLPAIAALAEAVAPRPLTVYAEIADAGEHYPFGANVSAHWLIRGAAEPGSPALMLGAVAELTTAPGYAYVLGESRAIVTVRDALTATGLTRNDVYAKGYWNLQSRPTR